MIFDLQSPVTDGHDPYTCKRSRSEVTWFERLIEWKQTDGQTDEWEPNALLSSLMQSVITVDFCQFSTDNSLLLLAIVISF